MCELGEELSATEDVEFKAHLALLRAHIRAARSDVVAAEELARHAVDVCPKTDYVERAAEAWLTLAEILGAKDDPGARAAASEALTLYEHRGNIVGIERVRSLLDESGAQ